MFQAYGALTNILHLILSFIFHAELLSRAPNNVQVRIVMVQNDKDFRSAAVVHQNHRSHNREREREREIYVTALWMAGTIKSLMRLAGECSVIGVGNYLTFSDHLYGLSLIFFLAQWKIAGPGFHHEARIGTLRHTTTIDVWFSILTDCRAINYLSTCCQLISCLSVLYGE